MFVHSLTSIMVGFAIIATSIAITATFWSVWLKIENAMVTYIQTRVSPKEFVESREPFAAIHFLSLVGALVVVWAAIDAKMSFAHSSGFLPYLGYAICGFLIPLLGLTIISAAVTHRIDTLTNDEYL